MCKVCRFATDRNDLIHDKAVLLYNALVSKWHQSQSDGPWCGLSEQVTKATARNKQANISVAEYNIAVYLVPSGNIVMWEKYNAILDWRPNMAIPKFAFYISLEN